MSGHGSAKFPALRFLRRFPYKYSDRIQGRMQIAKDFPSSFLRLIFVFLQQIIGLMDELKLINKLLMSLISHTVVPESQIDGFTSVTTWLYSANVCKRKNATTQTAIIVAARCSRCWYRRNSKISIVTLILELEITSLLLEITSLLLRRAEKSPIGGALSLNQYKCKLSKKQ